MVDVREEMNLILAAIEETDFKQVLKQALVEFEYQGLNVAGIAKEIYRRGLAGSRNIESVRKDVSLMILLFLGRGNNIDKMLTRTNDAGKLRITALKTTYAIANRVGRGGNTVITLSRVAAVFPLVTLQILADDEVVVPRAVTLSAENFGLAFPKQMQTVVAAAVFPKGAIGSSLMKALLLYLIEENKLLSTENFTNDQEILTKVIPYARASFVSSVILDNSRLGICKTLNLVTKDANPQPAASLQIAINTFNHKYPQADLSFIG